MIDLSDIQENISTEKLKDGIIIERSNQNEEKATFWNATSV